MRVFKEFFERYRQSGIDTVQCRPLLRIFVRLKCVEVAQICNDDACDFGGGKQIIFCGIFYLQRHCVLMRQNKRKEKGCRK